MCVFPNARGVGCFRVNVSWIAWCNIPSKNQHANVGSQMCKTLIPLLSDHGRIVNLSSVSSTLKPYSEQVRQRFRNPDMTLEELEQLVQEFEVSKSIYSSPP